MALLVALVLAPTFAAMSQAGVGAIRRDVLVVEPNRAEVVALAAQRRLSAATRSRPGWP